MVLIALCVFFAVKTSNTYNNTITIINAIHAYRLEYLWNAQVDYKDMESFERTLFRFWDWGYKRILPKAQFELIKPYIK
jgi:hypothetical protein